MHEIWNIKKILDWTQKYFAEKKMGSPRLDAELLLSEVLKLSRIELYLNFDRPLTQIELQSYKSLIKRRSESEPIAYILNHKDFYSRTFYVTPDVLIPRPDSEVLVEIVLKEIQSSELEKIIGFEMGLGSGCLSLTLLAENPKLNMLALDVSTSALAVAQKNAKQLDLENRIQMYCGDFVSEHQDSQALWCNTPLDIVISNPPYISENEFLTLDKDVQIYEPKIALTAGEKGLNFYAPLAVFAQKQLKPGGLLALEIGNEQAEDVMKILKFHNYTNIVCKKDYAGHDRVVLAKKSNTQNNEL